MARKSGSKIIGGKRKLGGGKKLTHSNHNSSGIMSKHSPKAMRGQGKC